MIDIIRIYIYTESAELLSLTYMMFIIDEVPGVQLVI